MSDPAEEAAQRVCEETDADLDLYRHQPVLSMADGSVAGCQCMDRVFHRPSEDWGSHLAETCSKYMEAAAREALAPLRELHRVPDDHKVACLHCHQPWPCDTARLIYPEEEL